MAPHTEAAPHGCASSSSEMKDSVALLFLTIRDVKNPDIWEGWLRDAPAGSYDIYVHAKVPLPLPSSQSETTLLVVAVPRAWHSVGLTLRGVFGSKQHPEQVKHRLFRDRQVRTVPTKWGTVSLVKAHINLIRAAVKNKRNRQTPSLAEL
jgi:hypothetical protein